MESETVGFVTSVEQLIPDYRIAYADFIAENQNRNHETTIKEYDLNLMLEMDADRFE